jgi:hypothetical protein
MLTPIWPRDNILKQLNIAMNGKSNNPPRDREGASPAESAPAAEVAKCVRERGGLRRPPGRLR